MSTAVAARIDAGGLDARAAGVRLAELFEAHGRMVHAVCRALLRDAHEADDATQASFLSAYEALLGGTVVRDPGAWLATIARNECRHRLRRRSGAPLPLEEDVLAGSVTPEDELDRRAATALLRQAIEELPEKQREAVVLRDLYGLHYGEICLALGTSRPSVEALLFRARRTLRVRLKPAAGTVLGVPLAVREGIAQAVPWFGTAPAVSAASAAGGAGILAKLGPPVAVKIAAAALAVLGTGTAAVEIQRGDAPAHVNRTPVSPPLASRPASPAPSSVYVSSDGPAVRHVVSASGTGSGQSVPTTADPVPAQAVRPASSEPEAQADTLPRPRAAQRPQSTVRASGGATTTTRGRRLEPAPSATRTRTSTTASRPTTVPAPRERVATVPSQREPVVTVATEPAPPPVETTTTTAPTRTETTPSR